MNLRTRLAVPALILGFPIAATLSLWAADPSSSPSDLPPPSNGAISPQNQADALHYVIAADREIYWRTYLAQTKSASVSTRANAGWPSPCELLRRSCESIQSQGAEFSYALRSLHPIDPRNEPQTELEQRALASISGDTTKPYYGNETLGGRRYFTAVYPDLPAAAACLDCHARKSRTGHPYRAGGVMGGLVIRVPLEF